MKLNVGHNVAVRATLQTGQVVTWQSDGVWGVDLAPRPTLTLPDRYRVGMALDSLGSAILADWRELLDQFVELEPDVGAYCAVWRGMIDHTLATRSRHGHEQGPSGPQALNLMSREPSLARLMCTADVEPVVFDLRMWEVKSRSGWSDRRADVVESIASLPAGFRAKLLNARVDLPPVVRAALVDDRGLD